MRKVTLWIAATVLACSALAQSTPGQQAFETGDYQKARAEIMSALESGDEPSLQLMLARVNIAQNRLNDAEQAIDQVLGSDQKNAQAWSLRGQLYGVKTSRASVFQAGKLAKESLASYETALELDPKLTDALTGMIRFRLRAPTLFGGSPKQALLLAQQLQRTDPVAGGLEIANFHEVKNNTTQRIKTLQQLTRDHPADPRPWLDLGFVEQGNRNWQQANDYFVQALNAAQGNGKYNTSAQAARYQIGRTAVRSGSNTEAGIKALSDYLEGPVFADLPAAQWAHDRCGLLYSRNENNKAKAERDFELAANTEDLDLKRALRNH